MAEFRMPSLGADMESAVLVEWQVHPGDEVRRGQVVAVVETDKGAIDVEVFEDGVIEELLVGPDTVVPVGTALARLRVRGESAEDGARAEGASVSDASTAEASPMATGAPATTPTATAGSFEAGSPRVSPRARKLAAELGVDLAAVRATGPSGSIVADDIRRASSGGATQDVGERSANGMRAAIAAAMSRSKREIPHYYLAHTADIEPGLVWLESRNAARPVSDRVLPVALFVRAVAFALRDARELCGWWRNDRFVPSERIDVGLAVAMRDGGLVNPTLHDADGGTLEELFARIRDVTQRARGGQLRSSEFADPAITITSLGDRGVDTVFGVIHPPQVAIVGIGSVVVRPWVVDGAVVPRRIVRLSLSADHRASDGHLGARFLRRISDHLQEPHHD